MRKILFTFCMAFLCACQNQNTQTLKVYAAASLTTALQQTGFVFETLHPGAKLDFNFSSSSTLAKQIEQGAKADLYISANPQWMDFLQDKQLLRAGSRINLLSNKLVCVVATSSFKIASLEKLKREPVRKIAVGDWSHVPVGIYAKTVFEKSGLWDEIENKLIPAVDARAALLYVERKQVDCGIVYFSDAMASSEVEIAFELPDSLQPEIYYPAAIIAGSQNPLLNNFINFLKSERALQVFRNNGFIVIPQDASD